MKITFIDPPVYGKKESVERVFGCNLTIYPVPNIFTLTTAALLRKKGYEVNYIDCANYNLSEKEFEDFIKKDTSDALSIHSVNLSKQIDLDALAKIRKFKGNIPVVFTGPGPTYFTGEFLKDEDVYVARGEPEITFGELAEELSRKCGERRFDKIDGLSYRMEGKNYYNQARPLLEDLDSLPFPARDLLDKRLYYNPKIGLNPWTVVSTSRGCSYSCIYCVPCSLSFARELEYKKFYRKKPPVRFRSIENVAKEFQMLKEEGYKSVSIIDDNFIWGEKRALDFCEAVKGLNIQWGCLARADHITEEIVRLMADAGCQYIDLGAESFNQKILDYVRKALKAEDIYRAIRIIKKYGISVKLNILLGPSPLETKKIILENIRIAKKLKPSTIMFSLVSPFPGTEWYEIVKKNNWFDRGDYYPINLQRKAVVSYPGLSSGDLEKLARRANFSYYLSPFFLLQGVRRIKSLRGLVNALTAYRRKLNL